MDENTILEEDREEERKIHLLLESIHTLTQLSDLHQKK